MNIFSKLTMNGCVKATHILCWSLVFQTVPRSVAGVAHQVGSICPSGGRKYWDNTNFKHVEETFKLWNKNGKILTLFGQPYCYAN